MTSIPLDCEEASSSEESSDASTSIVFLLLWPRTLYICSSDCESSDSEEISDSEDSLYFECLTICAGFAGFDVIWNWLEDGYMSDSLPKYPCFYSQRAFSSSHRYNSYSNYANNSNIKKPLSLDPWSSSSISTLPVSVSTANQIFSSRGRSGCLRLRCHYSSEFLLTFSLPTWSSSSAP